MFKHYSSIHHQPSLACLNHQSLPAACCWLWVHGEATLMRPASLSGALLVISHRNSLSSSKPWSSTTGQSVQYCYQDTHWHLHSGHPSIHLPDQDLTKWPGYQHLGAALQGLHAIIARPESSQIMNLHNLGGARHVALSGPDPREPIWVRQCPRARYKAWTEIRYAAAQSGLACLSDCYLYSFCGWRASASGQLPGVSVITGEAPRAP